MTMLLSLLINVVGILSAAAFTASSPPMRTCSPGLFAETDDTPEQHTIHEINEENAKILADALANSPPPVLSLNVAYHLKPERRDEFLEVMKNDLEPKAMQSVLGQEVDDSNKFYLHQEFNAPEDYNSQTTYKSDLGIDFFETDPFQRFPAMNDFELCHDGHAEKVANVVGAVCLNVEICIKPEVRDEFLAVMAQNKAGSDAEPLCMQYSWGESVSILNKFYFHEQYKGEEGLEAHFEGHHFKVWEGFASKADSPFEKPPIVQKFVIV